MANILSVKHLTRRYGQGDTELTAVNKVCMDIAPGDMAAIVGASGSGKTTLLNLLGCIDRPTSGEILFNGEDVTGMDDHRLAEIRRRKIGYIYQDFKLLPVLTAEENIMMPLLLDGKKPDQETLRTLAEELGIAHRLNHLPSELSGGQKQRVAIARAVIAQPDIILADEPTGNLDQASADEIMELLLRLNQSGKTILLVTHHEGYAARCSRVFRMTDGVLQEETKDAAASS